MHYLKNRVQNKKMISLQHTYNDSVLNSAIFSGIEPSCDYGKELF